MADEAAPPDEAAPERELGEPRPRRGSWLSQNRNLALALGSVALCGVIAIDLWVMLKSDAKRESVSGSASSAPNQVAQPPSPAAPLAAQPRPTSSSDDGESGAGAPSGDGQDYESDDGEPHQGSGSSAAPSKPSAPKHYASVQQAAVESCTTAAVDGLSRQIIAQARCIKPNAFVPLPTRPNLSIASQVFPYLDLDARNHLLKALDAKPKQKMTINSALRTVAQQYLVWRWSATKRCGVPLATPPGESNHEIGVALDIAEAGTWRPLMEAQDFRWLGASDRVHFDFKGAAAAPSGVATDVMAFQKLWNKNHPTDKINEDGRYSPVVEQRLKQAPPDGFEKGPSCKPN